LVRYKPEEIRPRRTYALHDHVHRDSKIDEFYAFVEVSCDDGNRREVYVRSERTMRVK
jgi:hypothetical protein